MKDVPKISKQLEEELSNKIRHCLVNNSAVSAMRKDDVYLLPCLTELHVTSSLKEPTEEELELAMARSLNVDAGGGGGGGGASSRLAVEDVGKNALQLDDFFGGGTVEEDEDEEEDEDFVDFTNPETGEWNSPTRGGKRPEPTRHGDWHHMGRCTDFS